MLILLYLCLGASVTVAAFFTLKHRAAYREVTVYEITDGMLPIDRERLLEIDRASKPILMFERNTCSYRREIRLDLECVKIQFERILNNAARPRDCAYSEWRLTRKHALQHPPEVIEILLDVRKLEEELRKLVRWRLFKIWLWNISGFHKRQWGPVPNMRGFCIPRILESYECVRQATVSLARRYGEAVLAEEIAAAM